MTIGAIVLEMTSSSHNIAPLPQLQHNWFTNKEWRKFFDCTKRRKSWHCSTRVETNLWRTENTWRKSAAGKRGRFGGKTNYKDVKELAERSHISQSNKKRDESRARQALYVSVQGSEAWILKNSPRITWAICVHQKRKERENRGSGFNPKQRLLRENAEAHCECRPPAGCSQTSYGSPSRQCASGTSDHGRKDFFFAKTYYNSGWVSVLLVLGIPATSENQICSTSLAHHSSLSLSAWSSKIGEGNSRSSAPSNFLPTSALPRMAIITSIAFTFIGLSERFENYKSRKNCFSDATVPEVWLLFPLRQTYRQDRLYVASTV